MRLFNFLTGKWNEAWRGTNGSAHVYALSRNAIVVGASTTYSTTEILGYRVLVQGSGNWSITPVDGSAQSIPQAAMVVGQVYPEHLSSITTPTSGSVLVYLP